MSEPYVRGSLLLSALILQTCAGCVPAAEDSRQPPMPPEPMRIGNPYTSRPLENMNRLFRPFVVEEIIAEKISAAGSVRVLEFGMGEARVLMQLRKRFPTAELHGINETPFAPEGNDDWVRASSVYHGIFTQAEVKSVALPILHFADVDDGRLPFLEDDTFDVIISQVSVGYIDRKDVLIEEFWRVLKPGGVALFDVDNFVVLRAGNVIALEDLVLELQKEGYAIELRRNEFPFVYMRKNTERELDMRLRPYRPDFPIFKDDRYDVSK